MTLSFSLYLPNGWSDSRPMKWFSSYFDKRISENKAFEWQTDYFGWTSLFRFDLEFIPTGSHHASIGFEMMVLGFMVSAKIYDTRHWDDDTGTWEVYDEEHNDLRMTKSEEEAAFRLEAAEQLVSDSYRKEARNKFKNFLDTPQGQQIIDQRVKAKLAEQASSKEAKKARGEVHRQANLVKDGAKPE